MTTALSISHALSNKVIIMGRKKNCNGCLALWEQGNNGFCYCSLGYKTEHTTKRILGASVYTFYPVEPPRCPKPKTIKAYYECERNH